MPIYFTLGPVFGSQVALSGLFFVHVMGDERKCYNSDRGNGLVTAEAGLRAQKPKGRNTESVATPVGEQISSW